MISPMVNLYFACFDVKWEGDTSDADLQVLIPDNADKIYDRDAPIIKQAYGATSSVETYNNFRQFVEWNSVPASDYAYWSWKGWWKSDQNPQVTLKEVSPNVIDLPKPTDAHY